MAATERVVVMMSRKEKIEVAKRAKAAKLSLSAYLLREALGSDEIPPALLDELRASTKRAKAALDHAIACCGESDRNKRERERQARHRAQAEFQDLDVSALFH